MISPVSESDADTKKTAQPRSRQIAPVFKKKQYPIPESVQDNEKRIGALLDDIKRSESLLWVLSRRKLKIQDSIASLESGNDTSHSQPVCDGGCPFWN